MLRRLRTLLIGAALGLAPAHASAGGTVVVELFTSQGCSSCPPADRLLRRLSTEDGIVALTLNVDYWDYLGWKDDLALPDNKARQRGYRSALGKRHVYTPQMVVDGRREVVGSRPADVMKTVYDLRSRPDQVAVDLSLEGPALQATLTPVTALPEGEIVLWQVGYDAVAERNIGAGENRGERIVYTNVVREWREAGRWDGTSALTIDLAPAMGDHVALLVQRGEAGPMLGSATIPMPSAVVVAQ